MTEKDLKPCIGCGNQPQLVSGKGILWKATCYCKNCGFMSREAIDWDQEKAVDKAIKIWNSEKIFPINVMHME